MKPAPHLDCIWSVTFFLLSICTTGVALPLSPCSLVLSPDGQSVFVAEAAANQVVRVDLATGRLRQVTPMPGTPSGLALSSDGKSLFVTIGDVTGRVVRLSLTDGHADVFPAAGHTLMAPVLSRDNRLL